MATAGRQRLALRTVLAAVLAAAVLLLAGLAGSGPAAAKTLRFAGYLWEVRGGHGGPGPNRWDPDNAWVDRQGRLHLRLDKRGGRWTAAEVRTRQRFGFGTFTFRIASRLDNLDRNVVLGLFTYPTADVGPDATHEIDIKIARWGRTDTHPLNFTVWPVKSGLSYTTRAVPWRHQGGSTHRFVWTARSVSFASFKGAGTAPKDRLAQWRFEPRRPGERIAQQAMPLHINLWGFRGKSPTDGQPVEIIIEAFSHQAAR